MSSSTYPPVSYFSDDFFLDSTITSMIIKAPLLPSLCHCSLLALLLGYHQMGINTSGALLDDLDWVHVQVLNGMLEEN